MDPHSLACWLGYGTVRQSSGGNVVRGVLRQGMLLLLGLGRSAPSRGKLSIELPFCWLEPSQRFLWYRRVVLPGLCGKGSYWPSSEVEVFGSPGHVVLGHGAGVGRGVLVPEWVDPVLAQLLQVLPALLHGRPATVLQLP